MEYFAFDTLFVQMHANSLLFIQVSSAGVGGKGISWKKNRGRGISMF